MILPAPGAELRRDTNYGEFNTYKYNYTNASRYITRRLENYKNKKGYFHTILITRELKTIVDCHNLHDIR